MTIDPFTLGGLILAILLIAFHSRKNNNEINELRSLMRTSKLEGFEKDLKMADAIFESNRELENKVTQLEMDMLQIKRQMDERKQDH